MNIVCPVPETLHDLGRLPGREKPRIGRIQLRNGYFVLKSPAPAGPPAETRSLASTIVVGWHKGKGRGDEHSVCVDGQAMPDGCKPLNRFLPTAPIVQTLIGRTFNRPSAGASCLAGAIGWRPERKGSLVPLIPFSGLSRGPDAVLLAPMVFVVVLIAIVPIWLSPSKASPAVLSTATGPAQAANPPAVPTVGHAYLGAFVDPPVASTEATGATGGAATTASELAALPGFDAQLGRSLSIVPVYQDWTEAFPQTQLAQVFASGAIPMLTWSCGDQDANVSAGADDALIIKEAQQLAASGMPVLFDWFANPNLPRHGQHLLGRGGEQPATSPPISTFTICSWGRGPPTSASCGRSIPPTVAIPTGATTSPACRT
jgi:hypothetical protein